MRRRAALVLLTALLLPGGVSFAAAAGKPASTSCAMACPHHGGSSGSDCCPVETRTEPVLRRCLEEQEPVLLPFSTVAPQLLDLSEGLPAPQSSGRAGAAMLAGLRHGVPRLPDHVPLPLA